jgi:hypothetical protein
MIAYPLDLADAEEKLYRHRLLCFYVDAALYFQRVANKQ